MLKGFLMAANPIGPGDAIVLSTDSQAILWLSGVSTRFA